MIGEQRMRVEFPAVLSLGSNLGDRETTIRDAVAEIAAIPGVTITAASSIVETAALKQQGVDTDAPAYLNAVVIVRTTLAPERLLEAVGAIERAHGRVRDERWGDRTLDIDIVACGGLRYVSETLTLPHPRAAERAFVLAPWFEIDPNADLPGYGRVADLLAVAHDVVWPFAAEALR